jgi:isopentenyldiphosphate isomerase
MKREIDSKDFKFDLNKHEVKDIKFIEKEELKEILFNKRLQITPWFSLILQKKIDEIFHMAKNFEDVKEKEIYPITNFLI